MTPNEKRVTYCITIFQIRKDEMDGYTREIALLRAYYNYFI